MAHYAIEKLQRQYTSSRGRVIVCGQRRLSSSVTILRGLTSIHLYTDVPWTAHTFFMILTKYLDRTGSNDLAQVDNLCSFLLKLQ